MAWPQGPENVLIVANQASAVSKSIAEYYSLKRGVPASQVCYLKTAPNEEITRAVYTAEVAAPIARCLSRDRLAEKILYIVTTLGVPLLIRGERGMMGDTAAVDSELTLLYATMHGQKYNAAGAVPNPFFRQNKARFERPQFPIYLVTRLAGYTFADVRGLVDRALVAANRGKVVLDMKSGMDEAGDDWLLDAAIRLPESRVILEQTSKVLYRQHDVIGYAAWGSNDKNRHERFVGFQWLPGAIMTEYVSSNGRTFDAPPDGWNISTWDRKDQPKWFKDSPQTLTADYVREGVTGASGHVDEPKLGYNPRPDVLFPAYIGGRNLAESYYLSIPALSWMNIVVGDPLCRLK